MLTVYWRVWANELIKVQYTRAYSQAVTDENGVKSPAFENLKNYDVTNENITSRPSADDDDTEPKTTPTVRLEGEVIIIEDEDVPLATFEDEEVNDVEIEEEAVPLAVAVDENCIIHWIIAIIMVAYAAYEVIRALTRKGKEVKKSEYVLTGVYVAVIVLLMSLGKCEADIFATVGGSVVAVADIVCKMIQAKKANSRVADTE